MGNVFQLRRIRDCKSIVAGEATTAPLCYTRKDFTTMTHEMNIKLWKVMNVIEDMNCELDETANIEALDEFIDTLERALNFARYTRKTRA